MPIKTLLVDDERSLLDQAEIFLERIAEEIEVQTVPSAEKALDVVGEEDFDVIVSDYQMPDKDGLEFLEELREERDSDIPFIMFTGKGREEVAMEALNLGADRYLQKGGDVKSQFGVLAEAIKQEFGHYSTVELLELTQYSVDRGDLEIYWITPKGKLTYVNKTVADHLGYSKDEMEGMNVWEVSPDFSKDMWEEHWKELKTEKMLQFESEHETKDGEIYPVEITSQYIEHKGKKYEFAFATDITEEKRKEKELKESKQRYEKMFYETPIGALHYDENGVITECNKKFVDIIGSSREDLIGFNMLNNLENDELLEELESSFKTGTGFYEGKYTSVTGGKTSWVRVFFKTIKDVNGERDFGIGLVEDITEKQEHYQELKRKEKYLDHTPIFINVVDEEGNLKYHSYPSGEGSNLDSEKLIGSDAMEYVHPDDREKTMEIFEKVIENPDETYTAEIRGKGDDGWIWLELNVVNRFDDPEIEGLIVTAQNITERKEAREEMKKSNERYETLFEENPEPVVQLDEEFRVLRTNSHFEKLFSFEEEEIKGESVNDLIVPEDRQDEAEGLDEKAKEGYINHETVRMDKEGNEIPVSLTSRPIEQNDETYHIAVYRDISEGKKTEEELKRKERYLNYAPAFITVFDENGDIKYHSRPSDEITGMDPSKFMGSKGLEIIHPDDREKTQKIFSKVFENPDERYRTELRVETKEGWKWFEVRAVNHLNDPEINGVIVTAQQINVRKKAERELKEREEKYRTIFESANDAIITMKKDRFIDCNEKTLEMFECDRQDIIGKPPYEFSPKTQPDGRDSSEKAMEKINLALEGKPQEFEWIHTTKDGEPFNTEVTLSRYILDDEKFVMAVVRDITEQKEREKKLKRTRDEYKELINGMNDTAWVLGFDGSILEVNDVAVEVLGYSRDEFHSMTPADIDPNLEEEKIMELIKNMKEDEKQIFETQHMTKSGDIIPVEISSSLINYQGDSAILSVARDITKRKAAMERIEQHKNKMRKLHETSAELQSYDSEEDLYSLVIEAAEDILDFEICSIDAVEGDKFVVKGVSSGTPEDGSTKRRIEKGGLDSKTYLNQQSYLVNDVSSNEDAKPVKSEYRSAISVPVGEYGVFQAVSKETNHFDEEDLRITELFASHISEALNRIKAKDREEFLHSLLRHDVGNKIQVIQGYLQLAEEFDMEEELKDFISKANTSVKSTQDMIEKIRTLRDISIEGEIETKEVCSTFEEVILDYRDRLEEQDIELEFKKKKIDVKGGTLLKEMFSNILENTIKHAECDEIRISCEEQRGEAVVRIEDDGKGIPDDIKGELFERGFKNGESGGSGLGLYLVKEIAKSYDGSVEVKDSDMGGARFEIHLERVQ